MRGRCQRPYDDDDDDDDAGDDNDGGGSDQQKHVFSQTNFPQQLAVQIFAMH